MKCKHCGLERNDLGLHEVVCEITKERDAAVLKLDAALKDLDEASPMRACARCGKQDRSHRMIWEEGDEMECEPCNTRCNAQERMEAAGESDAIAPACGGYPGVACADWPNCIHEAPK